MIDKETRQRWSRADRIRRSAKAIEGVFARRSERCPTCGERFKITGNPGPYICPDPWHGLSEGVDSPGPSQVRSPTGSHPGAGGETGSSSGPLAESDKRPERQWEICNDEPGYSVYGPEIPEAESVYVVEASALEAAEERAEYWYREFQNKHDWEGNAADAEARAEAAEAWKVGALKRMEVDQARAEAAEADAEEHLRRQVAAEAKLEAAERDWEGYEAKLQAAEAKLENSRNLALRAIERLDDAEAKLEAVREWAEAASKREPFTGPYNPDTYNHGIKSAGNFVLSLLAQEESE